jgi:hypothetical protein
MLGTPLPMRNNPHNKPVPSPVFSQNLRASQGAKQQQEDKQNETKRN